jgi:DNA-binding transcriptional LysR family regulator
LASVPLISPSADTPGGAAIIAAFRAAGLSMPPVAITTFSVHLRNILSMRGRFIAVLPSSVLWFGPAGNSLKGLPLDQPLPDWPALIVTLKNRTLRPPVERGLPLDLPLPDWPALIVTLKNRTLRPPVERFLACLRDMARRATLAHQ